MYSHGISQDPKKTKAITKMEPPQQSPNWGLNFHNYWESF